MSRKGTEYGGIILMIQFGNLYLFIYLSIYTSYMNMNFIGIALFTKEPIDWIRITPIIEESMRRCNIKDITIISPINVNYARYKYFPETVETFETYTGDLTYTQLGQSHILLVSATNELTDELDQKIKCFIENFIFITKISRDIISVVFFTSYQGSNSRKVISMINVQERTELEQLLNVCNESKNKLDNEYNNVLIKLDSLKEQLRQFNNKDPQQIQLNINKLQRELERIQREAEEAETARQREEKEQRRQQEEQKNCRSFGINPEPCIDKSHYRRQSVIFHPDHNRSCKADAEIKFKNLTSLSGCFEEENEVLAAKDSINKFREDYELKNPVRTWDSLTIPEKIIWVNNFAGSKIFGGSRKTIKNKYINNLKNINKKSRKINKKI